MPSHGDDYEYMCGEYMCGWKSLANCEIGGLDATV